ncbi:SWI/SNF-related matrix-associated actin-dependent regulator of chromatin subfamily D [Nematocida sp. LUAm3]|nr:SWI/SNF-related matrix-associated actin-dependent regulator of chromatin subfamily D [Nematocida sp. LUAm3]KAI5173875.1 SWI/SNF-related matrix-associated actin-dependent regulator of chromatin subfamily D [Nematocida sp. LUAm2]KAI5177380.1 SWI/SNF-related matrix-associated actin-dependent regulator of chromatin subfamily D [Nematocida sp. LUAm1]
MLRSERLMALFNSLMQTEKRLDEAITKKKMIVEEAHFKRIRKPGLIRLNVLVERNMDNSLFILVGGKIKIEEEHEEHSETYPLGEYVKRLLIDLSNKTPIPQDPSSLLKTENNDYSSNSTTRTTLNSSSNSFFEWTNAGDQTTISEFEAKTTFEAEKGKLYISLLSYTGRYKIYQELADAIGISSGTRPFILLAIWKYITSQKMKDQKNTKVILCNDIFKKLFNTKEILFSEIITRLDEFISPLEMISMDFSIPHLPGSKSNTSYDITVELDNNTKEYAYSDSSNLSILNKKINDILLRIDKQNEKIISLNQFISNPKTFISQWISESSKSLHLVADDLYDANEGFFMQKEVQESVYQLLQNYK